MHDREITTQVDLMEIITQRPGTGYPYKGENNLHDDWMTKWIREIFSDERTWSPLYPGMRSTAMNSNERFYASGVCGLFTSARLVQWSGLHWEASNSWLHESERECMLLWRPTGPSGVLSCPFSSLLCSLPRGRSFTDLRLPFFCTNQPVWRHWRAHHHFPDEFATFKCFIYLGFCWSSSCLDEQPCGMVSSVLRATMGENFPWIVQHLRKYADSFKVRLKWWGEWSVGDSRIGWRERQRLIWFGTHAELDLGTWSMICKFRIRDHSGTRVVLKGILVGKPYKWRQPKILVNHANLGNPVV